MRNYCLISILVLMLMVSAGFAQTTGFNQLAGVPLTNQASMFVPNWFPIAMTALMLSVGMIAILFMFGEAFNLPNVKSFARQEVYEMILSVLIILIVLGCLGAFGLFASNVAGSSLIPSNAIVSGFCADSARIYPISSANPENTLFADVDWFLGCMPTGSQGKYEKIESGVQMPYSGSANSYYVASVWPNGASKGVMTGHLMNIYISLFSLEFILGPISTFGVSAYLPEPIVSSISLDFAPHAALSPISEVTITITDLIGVGIGTLITQKVLLQFVHQNALVVFLPLGLAFRAIPFLRKTGSTIIALALVLYFVFPLSIWVNQQVYLALQNPAHPAITEWTNYHTILQGCLPQNAAEQADPSLITARVQQTIANPYMKDSQDAYGTLRTVYSVEKDANGNPVKVGLPIAQELALLDSFKSNSALVGTYLLHWGFIAGPTLPVDFFYSALVDQITVSSQWFVLNILFLVNTMIITITLFRDISLAIGGEPRIFGLSKLV